MRKSVIDILTGNHTAAEIKEPSESPKKPTFVDIMQTVPLRINEKADRIHSKIYELSQILLS